MCACRRCEGHKKKEEKMLSLSIDQIDIVRIYSVDYGAFGLPGRRRRALASNSVSAAARKGKVLMIGANFG